MPRHTSKRGGWGTSPALEVVAGESMKWYGYVQLTVGKQYKARIRLALVLNDRSIGRSLHMQGWIERTAYG